MEGRERERVEEGRGKVTEGMGGRGRAWDVTGKERKTRNGREREAATVSTAAVCCS